MYIYIYIYIHMYSGCRWACCPETPSMPGGIRKDMAGSVLFVVCVFPWESTNSTLGGWFVQMLVH